MPHICPAGGEGARIYFDRCITPPKPQMTEGEDTFEWRVLNGSLKQVGKKLTFRALALRSEEGLTLETSAFQSLYGGQFTLSTSLINQIFVYHSLTDAAPQFLQKLIPFTHKFHGRLIPTKHRRIGQSKSSILRRAKKTPGSSACSAGDTEVER